MLYLYCITGAPAIDLIPCPGIKEKRPYFIRFKDIATAVSDIESQEVELTSETVLLHEEVVEYLCREHTVLPVRFGSALRDSSEVRSFLARHHARITANIERVRGKVELGLKVIMKEFPGEKEQERAEDDPGGLSPAKAYLAGKLREEKRRQRLYEEADKHIDLIHQTLSSYASASSIRKLTTEKMILNSAYLVPSENEGAFRLSVEWLKNRAPSLSFLCSGPWPPYNFVSLDEGTDANEG